MNLSAGIALAALIVAAPAWAQSDAEARRLSVDAVTLHNKAMESEDLGQRLELLVRSHDILVSILRDYSTSEVSARLQSGEGIVVLGQPPITLERVNILLEEVEGEVCQLGLAAACKLIDLAEVSGGIARVHDRCMRIALGPITGDACVAGLSRTGGLFRGLGSGPSNPPFRVSQRIFDGDHIAQVFLAAWPDRERPILNVLAAFDSEDWERNFGKHAYVYVWNGLLSSPPSNWQKLAFETDRVLSQAGGRHVYLVHHQLDLVGTWIRGAVPIFISNMDRDPQTLLRESGRVLMKEWPSNSIIAYLGLRPTKGRENAIEEHYGSLLDSQAPIRGSD